MDPKRTQVFISYSRNDIEWLNRLRIHLRPLVRESTLEVWDDSKIQPGADWHAEIRSALTRCKVAVLLVSADFVGSDFIANEELPRLLDAADHDGAIIMPVIVSPSSFSRNERLSRFQSANPPSRPLIDMTRGEQEAVFDKVSEQVEIAIGRQELRAELTNVKEKVQQQQDIINRLVLFSMSFHIFRPLAEIYHRTKTGEEYLFNRGLEGQLRFLRDHGYIDWVGIRNLRDNQNLVGLVTLTPAGKLYVELREAFERSKTN
jgi:hypothetical protein